MTLPEPAVANELDREFVVWGEYGDELLGVRPMPMDLGNLEKVYELHSQHDALFSDLVERSFKRWAAFILGNAKFPMEVLVLPEREHVGYMYLTDVLFNENKPMQMTSASGHFSFWDGKIATRKQLVKQVIEVFARGYKLHRLWVRIPVYAYRAVRAAVQLGFSGPYEYRLLDRKVMIEGVSRLAIKYKGEWHDVLQLGLVGDELWEAVKADRG